MISVIIPACNNQASVRKTIEYLRQNEYKGLLKEIIVVDGGSRDNTASEAHACGAKVIRSIRKERSVMLNLGAENAIGKILYFLLPGALPPQDFCTAIVRATQNKFWFGMFTSAFANQKFLHRLSSWFCNRKMKYHRLEYQSLFVLKELFDKTGRFREDIQVMEDVELVSRLKRYSSHIILKEKILAPVEKSINHGVLRTELSYGTTLLMYILGYPQDKLVKVYNSLLGEYKAKQLREEIVPASMVKA